ncbi:MAG: ABC transporter ATP-binding protein [Acidimicrobiia bacterium]|nr:ABC transporter ATP-binding protein [Acidimicrobiia bacterium]
MIVEFAGVEKRYGDVVALGGVDLSIPEGSITGLIGPNGAGKTTSMLVMSTLLERDAGRVTVVGVDPATDPRAVRRQLGWMPDFFGFYDSLTTREYLDFFAAAQKIPAAKRPAIISDLLELVDLTEKVDADVNSLSRGMKQRLSLARALVHDPDLLILDEPASGLDPRARVQLRELIAELSRLGKTVIISSHILSELEGICSHMAVIDDGVVKAQGSMDEIRAAATGSRRVAARVPDERVDEAISVLESAHDVTDVVVEKGVLGFLLSGDDASSAEQLAGLVAAGVPVYEWRVEAAGLEELFMHLTRDEP